jgi:hypothetical protein
MSLPWALKVFCGILTDSFPLNPETCRQLAQESNRDNVLQWLTKQSH